MKIELATTQDFNTFWPIFQQIAKAADTYAYDPNITQDQARKEWLEKPLRTYMATIDNKILGSYYLTPNQAGPGDHVCNCGYMVSSEARGKGLATAMCEHSQQVAIELGFRAMQFNFVASSNKAAVALWQKLGFDIVGTLPDAFRHPTLSYVDAYVMHKALQPSS